MSRQEENPNMSRADFLRFAALGAGGLGLAALAGCGQKAAPDIPNYVFAITHGSKDPDRVILPLVIAQWGLDPERNPQIKAGGQNIIWFCLEGAELCKKGVAEKVKSSLIPDAPSAKDLIDELIRRGFISQISVCNISANAYKVKDSPAFDQMQLYYADPPWLAQLLDTHRFVWI